MNATIIRRVRNSLGANVYGQCVTVIVQLVGVPILLHAWGVQLYGEWLILFAIPAYLSITDLGFSQSAANDMTARVARGDQAGALRVFQSLVALVYGVAGLGLMLTAVVLWHLPLHDWLHFQAMDAVQVRSVLWLLAAQVFVALPNGVNHAGFRANGDNALHVGLDSTARLLQFGSIWIAALAGAGPVVAAAIFFGIRAVATAATAVLLVRRHRWLRFGITHGRRSELRALLMPALANIAMPLAQALNIQGMVLVVGLALSPLAVVVFSTLRTLTRLVLQMVLTVSHAAEPELAAAYGAGDRGLMRSLYVHALRGSLWLALAVAAGLALFGKIILDVWTNSQVQMDAALFAWLLGSAVAGVLWYGALIVLKSANRHLRAALVYMAGSAAAVGMAALLLFWTGDLPNVGLALGIIDLVMLLYTLKATESFIGTRPLVSLALAANPFPLLDLLRGKALVR